MTGLSTSTLEKICGVFRKHSAIEKAIIYGSRAKGNFKPGSDIDISLVGEQLNLSTQFRIESEIDDLLLPYIVDLNIFHKIENENLKDHIERVGVLIYAANRDLSVKS